MIIVADATPLNILVRVGCVAVLQRLFDRVLIPPAVAAELSHPQTPEAVLRWMASEPEWLEVRRPKRTDATLRLGAGETEAISLAIEAKADVLLVDDGKARRAAVGKGIRVVGTVGILETGARRGLLDLPDALDRLRKTDFRINERLLRDALRRCSGRGERS